MKQLEMVMGKMLNSQYYRSHREVRDVLCDLCRALLQDDYYDAVHIINDHLKAIEPSGMFVPDWQVMQYNEFKELSEAVSGVFVSKMEEVYGVI